MAPDLNSLPPSPYTSRQPPSSAARRTQDAVASPSIPVSLPSHSPSITARDPAPTASGGGDNTGVGVGPGNSVATIRSKGLLGLLLIGT